MTFTAVAAVVVFAGAYVLIAIERMHRVKVALGGAQPGVAGVVGPGDQPLNREIGIVLARDGNSARYLVVLKDPHSTRTPSATSTPSPHISRP